MAEKTFKLEVITPDRVVLSDDHVVSVTAPGAQGYLGVLANHAPLMTELAIGEFGYRKKDGGRSEMAIAGGFLEVIHNKVTVLAEIAERREEIDVDRAEAALHRAQDRLAHPDPGVDIDRARLALLKAMTRIRVARRGE